MSKEATDQHILEVMRSRPGPWFVYGDLDKATGYRPGKLYPSLGRLELSGRITSDWAESESPRRRRYQIAPAEPQESEPLAEPEDVLIDTGTYFVRVPKKREGS